MIIDWSEKKNLLLKLTRGVCFEDIVLAIDENRILDDLEHRNKERYPNQRILIVEIDNYAYVVPYVETEIGIFLKTIFPDRISTKKYLK